MKKLLLAIVVCLSPQVLPASEAQTAKQVNAEIKAWCKDHVTAFNTADYDKLKTFYRFPCAVLIDGEVQMATADGKPLVDFEKVKASGWSYSKIKKLKVLSTSGTSAMVSMTFTRMNEKDEELLTTTSFLGLTKVNNKWGLKTLFIAEDIPLD